MAAACRHLQSNMTASAERSTTKGWRSSSEFIIGTACLAMFTGTKTHLLTAANNFPHPLIIPINRVAFSRFPRADAPVYARRAPSQRPLPNHCYHQQPAQSTRSSVNNRCPFLRGFVRHYLKPENPALSGTCALPGWDCAVCNHHHMYSSPLAALSCYYEC